MKDTVEADHILQAITRVACQFLDSDMALSISCNPPAIQLCNQVTLKPVTVMMNISGCFSLDVTFSFDSSLIEQLFNVYCHELVIDDSERAAYIGETACDVINIVIGNSTELLAEDGTIVNISVPKVLVDVDSLIMTEQSMQQAVVATDHGDLMIIAMASEKQLS